MSDEQLQRLISTLYDINVTIGWGAIGIMVMIFITGLLLLLRKPR